MELSAYTDEQRKVLDMPLSGKVFLQGPAGSGKTTAGVGRLVRMIDCGIREDSILVLVPQRTLAQPYYDVLLRPNLPPGSQANIVTLGGLAQRMIRLFWPVAYMKMGFARPDPLPSFLTLETSQYYLDTIVKPMRASGAFETVHIEDSRLYSQILDNLNKSAAVGFPHTTIAGRLKDAWLGEPAQEHVYDEVQECANQFRAFCLANNLLDFSLQLEGFCQVLWKDPGLQSCRTYLVRQFRHLIYDNLEEDYPVAHDLVADWLDSFDSALLINDIDAGYRVFLGADPETGAALCSHCDVVKVFSSSLVTPAPLRSFQQAMKDSIQGYRSGSALPEVRSCVKVITRPFYPQMVATACEYTARLVNDYGVLPGEIAILSPFLSDALRFSLVEQLRRDQIPVRSHRPSRSLQEEPAVQCLLTFARLAHPEWGLAPSMHEVRYALMQAILGGIDRPLDLVRADLLAKITYKKTKFQNGLTSFDLIKGEMQERITHVAGQRFENLRRWLADYREQPPVELDVFLCRLFGEILSQPGYGFNENYDAASLAGQLVESIQKFRWATESTAWKRAIPAGQEYLQLVQNGLISAQYLQPWFEQREDAVLIAPAYTFLLNNRPVRYQFWLDVGSQAWWQRLEQPLTHPYVLSRRWKPGVKWSQLDEKATSDLTLSRLVAGLINRCSEGIFLCTAGMNEHGEEQRGLLLLALHSFMRQNPSLLEVDSV